MNTTVRILIVLRGAKVVFEPGKDKTVEGQTAENPNSALCTRHKECLILRRRLCAVWIGGWSAQSAHLRYCVERLIFFFMTPSEKKTHFFLIIQN